MSILNIARLIIYRCHQKGFELFLIEDELPENPDVWKLPKIDMVQHECDNCESIELDCDKSKKMIAIEADWHNIPSIKGLLRNDVKVVKSLVKETIPGIENGKFVAFKEVVKKAMPEEYKALKELKEIILEKKTINNI
jgi:hypothetical protein